ncbi:hypothetical protein HAX54_040052 [Datura stramonium]|uniref:Uncharacterized protein n=1 Tax=Datura stramonium TaxID=4076 RepID=A0ABS8SJV5_DATST|nr:hypothetical protein [Datura stramonium]
MGKKKFIDKKKAVVSLFARDSSDPAYESGSSGADRVFVRVDNNILPIDAFDSADQYNPDNPNSIFADAPEDEEEYNATLMSSRDVKAYDASKVEVAKVNDDSNGQYVYNVAAKTVGDLELEEDFVIKANLPDGPVNVELGKNLGMLERLDVDKVGSDDTAGHMQRNEAKFATIEEKPRARRLLDEQFDLLQLEEYGLILKMNMEHAIDGLGLNNNGPDNGELLEPAADVISRCREYAEKYENESPDEEAAIFDESSSDSELLKREKKLLPAISEACFIISFFKGKEKLPVDYLPSKGKHALQKEGKKKQGSEKEEKDNSKMEQLKRKQHGQESKEEKKERKAAVKEERREARRMKKEMKELYKCEAQRAQKVAAFTGPSSIHLM